MRKSVRKMLKLLCVRRSRAAQSVGDGVYLVRAVGFEDFAKRVAQRLGIIGDEDAMLHDTYLPS